MKKICSCFSITLLIFILGSCQQPRLSSSGGIQIKIPIDRDEKDTTLIKNTLSILQTRIHCFCKNNPEVKYDTIKSQIIIELPKETDTTFYRKLISTPGQFRILESYDNQMIFELFEKINEMMKTNHQFGLELPFNEEQKEYPFFNLLKANISQEGVLYSGPEVGFCNTKDTSIVHFILEQPNVKHLFPDDLQLYWKHDHNKNDQIYSLIAVKEPIHYRSVSSDMIKEAYTDKSRHQYDVLFEFKKEYHSLWEEMTRRNIGQSLPFILDHVVYSYPHVQGEITGGKCSLTGNFTEEESKFLAAILQSGELSIPLANISVTIIPAGK